MEEDRRLAGGLVGVLVAAMWMSHLVHRLRCVTHGGEK